MILRNNFSKKYIVPFGIMFLSTNIVKSEPEINSLNKFINNYNNNKILFFHNKEFNDKAKNPFFVENVIENYNQITSNDEVIKSLDQYISKGKIEIDNDDPIHQKNMALYYSGTLGISKNDIYGIKYYTPLSYLIKGIGWSSVGGFTYISYGIGSIFACFGMPMILTLPVIIGGSSIILGLTNSTENLANTFFGTTPYYSQILEE